MIDFIAAKRHAASPHILFYHAHHVHPTYHVLFSSALIRRPVQVNYARGLMVMLRFQSIFYFNKK
jgi:hypothetical protein